MKKIIAAFLSVVLIIALASNAFAANSFPDIKDETLAREVAVLQMLGVISGDGNGNFVPDGTLSRAAFCTMAVIMMGRGDEEPLYRNRTIFPDVRAGHWARGYINVAVSGEKKIIVGTSDGTFKPDADITYAQAVTILVRMLGFTDGDAGMQWPTGYLTLGKDTGLTDGLEAVQPGGAISRAQAAHLFCNLLSTPVKGGASYISTLGPTTSGIVIMQLDVRADDGTSGAIRTSEGILKTVNGVVPPSILGQRGMLLKDATGKVLTFLSDENRQHTITASLASASWIKDASGVRYDISPEAFAYTTSDSDKFGNVYMDIAPGMKVTLFYSADGKVDALYINTSKSGEAIVAGADASIGSFGWLTGGDSGYTVYKNGAPAALSDIRQYDVITYDRSAKILNVTDFRLTGCYENCWPNMASPSRITVMGKEFTVLPSAIDSLANYKIGQVITLLFTSDLQVAGAAISGVSGSNAVGIVQEGITAESATVKLLNGLELKGNPMLGSSDASQYSGELVKVYSSAPGQLSLSKLYNTGAGGDLDLAKGTMGSVLFSPAIKVFERVGTGAVTQIALGDLTQTKISASKVLYAGTDYAGRVDILVLNDVTGDRYTYGFLKETTSTIVDPDFGNITNRAVAIINSKKSGTESVLTGYAFTNGAPGGIAVSTDGQNLTGLVTLTEVKNVSRTAFYTVNGQTYVHLGTLDIMVSKTVECYNKLNNTWFTALNDARAFSETLTVYYDRAPSEGGKIRMVIAG